MLWTAPPPASEWVLLRPPQFGRAKHASDYNGRSRYRQVGIPGPFGCVALSKGHVAGYVLLHPVEGLNLEVGLFAYVNA